jgi:hypothetical protein
MSSWQVAVANHRNSLHHRWAGQVVALRGMVRVHGLCIGMAYYTSTPSLLRRFHVYVLPAGFLRRQHRTRLPASATYVDVVTLEYSSRSHRRRRGCKKQDLARPRSVCMHDACACGAGSHGSRRGKRRSGRPVLRSSSPATPKRCRYRFGAGVVFGHAPTRSKQRRPFFSGPHLRSKHLC